MQDAEFAAVVESAVHEAASEQGQSAKNILDQMVETNLLGLLTLLGRQIVTPIGDRPQVAAIALLLNVSQNEKVLEPDVIAQFWASLVEAMPTIFDMPSLLHHHNMKVNVAQSIVPVVLSAFAKGQMTFQNRLIELYSQNRGQEEFYISAIGQILMHAQDLCGFELPILIEILQSPLPENVQSTLPRVVLFFALAKITNGEEGVIRLFENIIGVIRENELPKALNVMADFCTDSAHLLLPYMTQFVEYLCGVAKNGAEAARNPAMFVLQAAICHLVVWFEQRPDLVHAIFTCLISIISEVGDNDPLLMDDDEVQLCPYVIAAETIQSITLQFESPTSCAAFMAARQAALQQGQNSVQAVFGAIAATSYLSRPFLGALFAADTEVDTPEKAFEYLSIFNGFFEPLLALGFDRQQLPRLRVVALQSLIHSFSTLVTGVEGIIRIYRQDVVIPGRDEAQRLSQNALHQLLELISSEDNPVCLAIELHVVNEWLATCQSSGLHPSYIEPMLEMFRIGAQRQTTYRVDFQYIQGLGLLCRNFLAGSPAFFAVAEIEIQLAEAADREVGIRVVAISQFALAAVRRIQLLSTNPAAVLELREVSKRFLVVALALESSDLDEKNRWVINSAIQHLLRICRDPECAGELGGRLLARANAQLEILTYPEMRDERDEMSSLLKVESHEPGHRQYVLRSEAIQIATAFTMMSSVIGSKPPNLEALLSALFARVDYWLNFSYCVDPIDASIWNFLSWLVLIKFPRAADLVIQYFRNNLKDGSSVRVFVAILDAVSRAVSHRRGSLDGDALSAIIAKGTFIIEKLIANLAKKVNMTEAIGNGEVDESSRQVSDRENMTPSCIGFIETLMETDRQAACAWFSATLEGQLRPLLGRPSLRLFALSLYAVYFHNSHDLALFGDMTETFAQLLQLREVDVHEHVLLVFHDFLEDFHIPNRELVKNLYTFFGQYLNRDMAGALDLASDLGLITLSSLILNNFEAFEAELGDVLDTWTSFFPLWQKFDEALDVYRLMAVVVQHPSARHMFEPTAEDDGFVWFLNQVIVNRLIFNMPPECADVIKGFIRQWAATEEGQIKIDEWRQNLASSEAASEVLGQILAGQ